MAQKVTVQQAALNALATYLASEFASESIQVEPRWPEPSVDLPDKVVTLITAGPRVIDDVDVRKLDSIAELPTPDPIVKLVTWELSGVMQPVQLDVWAKYDVDRDDILARLDESLNKGLGATLGQNNADPTRDGPLVALGNGWTGHADFTFDGPFLNDSPGQKSRHEFRATMRGEASMKLTTTSQTAKIAEIQLLLKIAETDPANVEEVTVVIDANS